MPRIKGINTKEVIKHKMPATSGRINKGTAKIKGVNKNGVEYLGYGKELEDKLRITTNPELIGVLQKYYKGKKVDEQTLILKYVNIVLGFNDPEKTFYTEMTIFKGSKKQQSCDGKTIFAKYLTDSEGKQTKVECNKPCQKGDNKKCPLECELSGILYFYILELLKDGYQDLFRINIRTIKDIQDIQKFIDDLCNDISHRPIEFHPPETIKSSPVITEEFRTYKPIVLYKVSRYNQHYKRNYWYFALKLHPDWLRSFEAFILLQQQATMQLPPSQDLVAIAHGQSFVRKIEQVTEVLPPAPQPKEWSLGTSDIDKLQQLYLDHGWHENALQEMLFSYFGYKSQEDINAMNQEQFSQLLTYLADQSIKTEFLPANVQTD